MMIIMSIKKWQAVHYRMNKRLVLDSQWKNLSQLCFASKEETTIEYSDLKSLFMTNQNKNFLLYHFVTLPPPSLSLSFPSSYSFNKRIYFGLLFRLITLFKIFNSLPILFTSSWYDPTRTVGVVVDLIGNNRMTVIEWIVIRKGAWLSHKMTIQDYTYHFE